MKNSRFKFRAWDKFTKRMWKWEEHNAFGTNKGSIKDWFTDSDLIQQQFTGLKDAEGKEIYEGDILDATKSSYLENEERRVIVAWHSGSVSVGFDLMDAVTKDWAENLFLIEQDIDTHGLTFIGNIFQNKKLLIYAPNAQKGV